MSKFEPARLSCVCGTEFEVMAADSLHITNLPEVRAKIVDGGFHVFGCPSCGARVQLDKLLAYTDFDRWEWFTVFPETALADWRGAVAFAEASFHTTVEDRSAPLVKTWAPKLRARMRAIFGVQALREKLLVLDAGLDDRTIEALKLQIIEWYDLRCGPDSHLWFSRVEDDQLVFAWAVASGPGAAPPVLIAVPRTMYQQLVYDRDAARALAPILLESIAVDFRIAHGAADAAAPTEPR
jgi:hypothetical protein